MSRKQASSCLVVMFALAMVILFLFPTLLLPQRVARERPRVLEGPRFRPLPPLPKLTVSPPRSYREFGTTSLALDGTNLSEWIRANRRLDNIYQSFGNIRSHKIVVYALALSDSAVVVLRFSSDKTRETTISFGDTGVEAEELKELVRHAREPISGAKARAEIRSRLWFDKNEREDRGKTVLFADFTGAGTIPESFGLRATTIGSLALTDCLRKLKELKAANLAPSEILTVFGLPETQGEYSAVFKGGHYAQLSQWAEEANQFRALMGSHHATVITPRELSAEDVKAELLKRIEDAHGVLVFVAHANGRRIELPGSSPLSISPKDIAQLHFKYSPVIFLRVCNGVDGGFADAFLRAGAVAVSANAGPIRPGVAREQIEIFLDSLASDRSVFNALNAVNRLNRNASVGVNLRTELLSRPSEMPQSTGAGQ